MPVRTLDYSALTDPVSSDEVAAWRTAARQSGAPWSRGAAVIGPVSRIVLLAVLFGAVFLGALGNFFVDGVRHGDPVSVLLPLIFLGIGVWAIVTWWRARETSTGTWTSWYRLSAFAAANGMNFTPRQGPPNYPGEIFGIGRDAAALAHLTSTSGRYLDLGNYCYTTGSGRSSTTHYWGFMALALDRAMPNIVLDSKANNTLFGTNLPATLDKSQVLHLEGDFDKYFTLYCPKEYEQDALYIFTPDLMALLIDEAAPFDVELVDRWMFVYSAKPFAMKDPATLERLFTIADTVGAKTLTQTEHYADDRVGDPAINAVASQGLRLKHGVSILGVVIVAGFVVFWGWNFVRPFFGG
jgi:hypothetical protein